MSNNLLTDQHIAAEALMILENELVFTKQINRTYDAEYKGAKRGATIYVKRPPMYTTRDGQNVSIQDTTITQVPVTLNHQFGIDCQFSSQDLTLSISEFGKDVLQPQISQIAQTIDFTGLQLAATAPNMVGTPGITPGTGSTPQAALQVYAQAAAVLDKHDAPRDKRRALFINEDAQAITVPNLAGLYNPTTNISDQYENGEMGRALGFKWGMTQNIVVPTLGAQGGTPLVAAVPTAATAPNGTTLSPTGSTFSVSTKGWTANTQVLNANDVVAFGGCYGLYPSGKQNTNRLRQFTVTANVTSDGSGNATLLLAENMITTASNAAWANVSALPAINAPITVNNGTGSAGVVSPQNIAMHGDAMTFACVDLPLPGGVHMAARKSDPRLKISMRFVAAYNISTDQFIGRFDVLCGFAMLRPYHIVRMPG